MSQDLKLKIFKQKVLYKEKFEKYTKGNDNADKLAKIGASNDNKFNLPYCKDNYFLINSNNQIIHKKIQNYLTKSEHYKISKNYQTRLLEKWNIPENLIHNSSFDFNKKIHWKNMQAIDFLIKLRAKDLKLKDKIFEQINNTKEYNIDLNNRTSKWIKYWKMTYKDTFCELCKHHYKEHNFEDIDHLIKNCKVSNSSDNLMLLQTKIKDLIYSNCDSTKFKIPCFFLDKPTDLSFSKYNNFYWNSTWGMLGFIPNEFINFLKQYKVKNIDDLIFKIQITLGQYWKNLYKNRCTFTAEKLNSNHNFNLIFSKKSKKHKIT